MEKSKESISCAGCKDARWIISNDKKILWCNELDRKVSASCFSDRAPSDCPKNKSKKLGVIYTGVLYKGDTPKEKEKKMSNTRPEFKDVGVSIYAETVNDAWEKWYSLLSAQAEKGKHQGSRDGEVVGEIISTMTVVEDPTRFIVTSPIRKMPMRYAVGELLWYLSGNPDLDAIRPFTSAWDRMSDDGKTVNSNYGEKIYSGFCFNQWEYVKECLKKDALSRQAVINIREPKDYIAHPTKDMPCTLTLQFLARPDINGDMCLHLTTNMRSNDIWMGFPYDCFNFCAFLCKMAMELGFKVGTYTHYAGSLHLYRRDYEKGKGAKENVEKSRERD